MDSLFIPVGVGSNPFYQIVISNKSIFEIIAKTNHFYQKFLVNLIELVRDLAEENFGIGRRLLVKIHNSKKSNEHEKQ